jgi:TolB-like protein/Tfp pilus assembly protein PilF
MNFFSELKRRNVYKVAVAYAIVGWLLVQVATQVFPFLEIPNWAIRLVILFVAIGFPIALIIAWAFELTPEGIKRTESADAAREHSRGRVWIAVVLIAAILSIGLFFVGRYTALRNSGTRGIVSSEKSLAVLPFESLSEDKSNAYFAEGIQEEILTRLAKIADLKVISRTSTQQYQSKPGNLSEIAKQLGVANILEGSVQKAADQVRVNVQLINAQTDSHLWADTYDRKLTDIFGVESEVAKAIAESLQAKLTGREEKALAIKPTNNPEAYDAYLRGLAFEAQNIYSVYPLKTAIGFYEQAVQLDPAFALAWSKLARAEVDWYLWGETTTTHRDAAKRALDNALKLQPNSPETLLALGYYQYQVLGDYGLAKTSFETVTKMLPGGSEAPAALGRIARLEGHWDESIAYFEQALLLDPRNTGFLIFAADTYDDLRQFPAALKLYDRALDIRPNDLDQMSSKAVVYQAEGNLEEAAKLLAAVNAQTPSYAAFDVKITQLRLERHYDEAVRLLQARFAQFHFGLEVEKGIFQTALAFTQHIAGDGAGAKITAEQARSTLEPLRKSEPNNDFLPVFLSRAYAALGDKSSALKEA